MFNDKALEIRRKIPIVTNTCIESLFEHTKYLVKSSNTIVKNYCGDFSVMNNV